MNHKSNKNGKTVSRVNYTNNIDKRKILSEYEQDYVKTAENVINRLVEKYDNEEILTTSKIRNILAMTSDIYNDVNDPSDIKDGVLSEGIKSRIKYLKIRIIYEAGREKSVKNFVEESCIIDIITSIGNKKEAYIKFSRYMEALVAYRKYLVPNDK